MEDFKKYFFGAIGGVVVAIIVAISFGWLITPGTAQEMSDEAVLSTKTAICVGQFKADAEFEKHSAAFMELSSWERDGYIEDKGSWAVMPGSKTAEYSVADDCADVLQADLK